MAYPLNSYVQLTGQFTDTSGELADPTTVTLYLLEPGQSQATPHVADVTRDSVGTYHLDVNLNVSGTWTYCWTGVGALAAATFDVTLEVAASALQP